MKTKELHRWSVSGIDRHGEPRTLEVFAAHHGEAKRLARRTARALGFGGMLNTVAKRVPTTVYTSGSAGPLGPWTSGPFGSVRG